MFWRGARPGYTGTVDEKHEMTQKAEDDLQTQLNEYEHNLRRFLITEGVDIQALAGQVSDPLSHVDVQLQMISAATSIPKRILVGSERGELASTQDQDNWRSIVKARRENWAETAIVRPFITVCMKHGILPFITDYTIRWSDLFAMGEKQKAEVGQIRSTALASYAAQLGAENIVPAEAFFEFFLGLNEDQITLITKMREQRIKDDMIEEEPINEEEE